MRTQMLLIAVVAAACPLFGQMALVQDINTSSTEASSAPYYPLFSAGRVFFGARDAANNLEIWVSDGTASGTQQVADLVDTTGPQAMGMVPFGTGVLFSCQVEGTDSELWISDGTAAGTKVVLDINPGSAGSEPGWFTQVGGKYYFSATHATYGRELWVTDGTAAGTQLVADIVPGTGSSNPSHLRVLGNNLFFYATTPTTGLEPWVSDGTAVGTVQIGDISLGSTSSVLTTLPISGVVGGRLYFWADDGTHGREPWYTDGSAAGTAMLVDLEPGSTGTSVSAFAELPGNKMYMAVHTLSDGFEPWVTDGTVSGTQQITSLAPGSTSGVGGEAVALGGYVLFWGVIQGTSQLYRTNGTAGGTQAVLSNLGVPVQPMSGEMFGVMGGHAYFNALSSMSNYALWRSDGTAGGTISLSPREAASWHGTGVRAWTAGSGVAFFCSYGGYSIDNNELWKTDGTVAGTQQVANIYSLAGSGLGSIAKTTSTHALLLCDDGSLGSEPWVTDGTAAGTVMLADANPGAGSSSLSSGRVELGGKIYFALNNSVNGAEVWVTDFTPAGTMLLKDIYPGTSSGTFTDPVVLGSNVLFGANDGVNGRELWISDGTAAGTVLLKDINSGAAGSEPEDMAVLGNRVLFAAAGPGNDRELWITDGTGAGTTLLKNINATGSAFQTSAFPYLKFVAVGGGLVFAADDGVHGRELWYTDGTLTGTVLLGDLNPGSASSSPDLLEVHGGLLYVKANTTSGGSELWRTDGTSAGTVYLGDLNPGTAGSSPAILGSFGGYVYFRATTAAAGTELWRTDGTAVGTSLFKDCWPGTGSGNPWRMGVLGATFLFSAADGANGTELWQSDGTSGGTQMLVDLRPGPQGCAPASTALGTAVVVGGKYIFSAHTPATGRELWQSDGTAAGTVLVQELMPGAQSCGPVFPFAWGSRLLVSANTPTFGTELWLYDPGNTNQAPVLTFVPGPAVYTENGLPVLLDNGAGLSDVDSPDFSGGWLRVEYAGGGSMDDTVGIRHTGTAAGQIGVAGASVLYGGSAMGTFTGGSSLQPLQVQFNSGASVAAVQALLRALEFSVSGDAPNTATRVLRLTVNDGDGGTSSQVLTDVDVVAVNDPPVVTVTGGVSLFTGPANGPFSGTWTSTSGTGSYLTVMDLDGNIAIASISVTPAASATFPQQGSIYPSGGYLHWNMSIGNNLPGAYVWSVLLDDAAGGQVAFTVTINITNEAPLFMRGADALGVTPYLFLADTIVGTTPSLHMADAYDHCALQTLTMLSVTPSVSNPSSAFTISMTSGLSPRAISATCAATLSAADVGVFTFNLDVSDGLVSSTLQLQINVVSAWNLPPFVSIPAGSAMTGSVAAGFSMVVTPLTLLNSISALQAWDPDNDSMNIVVVAPAQPQPNGLYSPTPFPSPVKPLNINFSGSFGASEPPGVYTWAVTITDTAGNLLTFSVSVELLDAAPTHVIGFQAIGGSGTPGDAYRYWAPVGTSVAADMAHFSDANSSQVLTLVSVSPDVSNPVGGSGFLLHLTATNVLMLETPPGLVVELADVGTHRFVATVSDGANSVDAHVVVIVPDPNAGSAGGGGSGGGDSGCALATGAVTPMLPSLFGLLLLARRRRNQLR